MATNRHEHGAFLGGGYALDEAVVLLLLSGHRIGPFAIVIVVVGVHPDGRSFVIDAGFLIFLAQEKVILRAD